ncbi:hypothetical protein BS78_10G180300 [Paspalum vaginatum]|nr:hypothetical protein BS78_10G180300 [Paspalum vaginatum]
MFPTETRSLSHHPSRSVLNYLTLQLMPFAFLSKCCSDVFVRETLLSLKFLSNSRHGLHLCPLGRLKLSSSNNLLLLRLGDKPVLLKECQVPDQGGKGHVHQDKLQPRRTA